MRPSASMFTDTLTILTPGTTTDRVGDALSDWSAPTRRRVRGRISQRNRSEDNDGRAAQVGEWVAYLPGGTPIDGRCRVTRTVSGREQTFDVVGPAYEPTAAGGRTHVEVTLRLVEG